MRVNKVALARELGISRTPLREALFGLEREGLVVSHLRRGFFVSPLGVKDAREVYPLLATLAHSRCALARKRKRGVARSKAAKGQKRSRVTFRPRPGSHR